MADLGHINNVAHFEELVGICAALGGTYDPSNGDLALNKITDRHTLCEGSLSDWGGAEAAETLADTNRENAFDAWERLATRIVNYYISTDAPENRKQDAKEILRLVRGRRAKKLVDDPNTPEDESQGGNSVAQTSYVQRVDHFDGLIDLYTADGMYNPNEDAIKLATFVTFSAALKDFNTGSFNANTNTTASRSEFFVKAYTGENNMIDNAMQIKKYLKALLGPSNIIYKQAARLRFKRPKV